MPTVLLTGGAGFIGRELLRSLTGPRPDLNSECSFERDSKRDRYEVDVLDTDEAIFANARYMDRFRRFYRTSEIKNLCRYDFIIHAGAISDSRCQDVKGLIETNYELTMRLAEHRRASGGRMVYFSSASVYGDRRCLEDCALFEPQTPYAVSKLLSDKALLDEDGFCIVRPFNVYGTGEHSKKEHTRSLLYRIAHAAGTNTPMKVFARDSMRDFISSVDVAEAVVDLMESPREESFRGQVFNLGRGEAISVRDLIRVAALTAGHSEWLEDGENPYIGAYQSISCAVFSDKKRAYDPNKFRNPLVDLGLMVKRFQLGDMQ